MAHPSFQSLDTKKVDLENKREGFLRVLTAMVIVLTTFQVGMASSDKGEADALLGTFVTLILVLSIQAKHIEQMALLTILGLVCLTRIV